MSGNDYEPMQGILVTPDYLGIDFANMNDDTRYLFGTLQSQAMGIEPNQILERNQYYNRRILNRYLKGLFVFGGFSSTLYENEIGESDLGEKIKHFFANGAYDPLSCMFDGRFNDGIYSTEVFALNTNSYNPASLDVLVYPTEEALKRGKRRWKSKNKVEEDFNPDFKENRSVPNFIFKKPELIGANGIENIQISWEDDKSYEKGEISYPYLSNNQVKKMIELSLQSIPQEEVFRTYSIN